MNFSITIPYSKVASPINITTDMKYSAHKVCTKSQDLCELNFIHDENKATTVSIEDSDNFQLSKTFDPEKIFHISSENGILFRHKFFAVDGQKLVKTSQKTKLIPTVVTKVCKALNLNTSSRALEKFEKLDFPNQWMLLHNIFNKHKQDIQEYPSISKYYNSIKFKVSACWKFRKNLLIQFLNDFTVDLGKNLTYRNFVLCVDVAVDIPTYMPEFYGNEQVCDSFGKFVDARYSFFTKFSNKVNFSDFASIAYFVWVADYENLVFKPISVFYDWKTVSKSSLHKNHLFLAISTCLLLMPDDARYRNVETQIVEIDDLLEHLKGVNINLFESVSIVVLPETLFRGDLDIDEFCTKIKEIDDNRKLMRSKFVDDYMEVFDNLSDAEQSCLVMSLCKNKDNLTFCRTYLRIVFKKYPCVEKVFDAVEKENYIKKFYVEKVCEHLRGITLGKMTEQQLTILKEQYGIK